MDFILSGPNGDEDVRYYITKNVKDEAYIINLGGHGWGFKLSDIEFEIKNDESIIQYNCSIGETNPVLVVKDDMIVYPFPSGDKPIWDNSTAETVTGESSLEDYAGCYIAYVDKNIDKKIGPDDEIWVYKDYNADGIDDVKRRYKFTILDEDNIPILSKQL